MHMRAPTLGLVLLIAALAPACGPKSVDSRRAVEPPADAQPAPERHMPGTVQATQFHSDALGADKNVVVYLPAGYEAGTLRYPVFYYLHGNGGDETTWTKEAKLAAAADALGLQAIIVMPQAGNSYYVGTYEQYVSRDLVAWVDRTYRTIASRDGRAIAGMSAGGYGALHLAMRHPDLYSAAVGHAPVTSLAQRDQAWLRQEFEGDLTAWPKYEPVDLVATLEPGRLHIYLDVGTEDGLAPDVLRLHQLLARKKIEHAFYTGPGRHDYDFAIERTPKSLAFLREHMPAPR